MSWRSATRVSVVEKMDLSGARATPLQRRPRSHLVAVQIVSLVGFEYKPSRADVFVALAISRGAMSKDSVSRFPQFID